MKRVVLWFAEITITELKILQLTESKIKDFNEYLEGIIQDHLEKNMDVIKIAENRSLTRNTKRKSV